MPKIKVIGDSRAAHDLLHARGIHHHGDLVEIDGVLMGGSMEEFRTNADPQVIANLVKQELPETKVMVKRGWFWVEL